jgi:hypothetical protein
MKKLQYFTLEDMVRLGCKINTLEHENEELKAILWDKIKDMTDKVMVVWSTEIGELAEASKLKIEKIKCMCGEEDGLRFYIDHEN